MTVELHPVLGFYRRDERICRMSEKNLKQTRHKKKYPVELVKNIIDLAVSKKVSITQLSRAFDIPVTTIQSWVKRSLNGSSSNLNDESEEKLGSNKLLEIQRQKEIELHNLRIEVQQLRQDNAFLKKAASYFAKLQK